MLKKILKWLWEFLEILIIIYVIFITSCILCRNKFGYTQFGDMTFVTVSESNEKFFMNNKAGDLLIIKNQQMNLDVNDLIYYYVTVDEKYIVRTGVIDSKSQDDYAALYVLRDDEGIESELYSLINENTKYVDKMNKIYNPYSTVHVIISFLNMYQEV